jgi:hypothetical protein
MWEPWGPNTDDHTIMDYAVKDSKLAGNKSHLAMINKCRLYLKVLWVRDLFQTGTENLDWHIVRGLKQNESHPLTFPFQNKPSVKAFTLWKEFIFRSFVVLRQDDQGQSVYRLPDSVDSTISTLPTKTSPTDFDDIITSINFDGNLCSKFKALPQRFKDIIGSITLPSDEGQGLVAALKIGQTILASDGSYLLSQNRGSHAYKIISKVDGTVYFEGYSLSPNSNKMSSSPTEHYGAIAILTILVVVIHHQKVSARGWPDVTLLIDNKEVVDRGEELWPSFMNVSNYLVHDFDLWMVMAELQRRLFLTINFQWIRSHQTDVSPETDSTLVQLNNDVDILASKAYSAQSALVERGTFLAGSVCYHQSGHHVQDIYDAIRSRESNERIIDYYRSKGWTLENLEIIDWHHMDKFLRTQSPIARCKILQSMHNWQNTGTQKLQFYQSQQSMMSPSDPPTRIDKCPMGCGQQESAFHYMYCMSEEMCLLREKELETMLTKLRKLKTSPPLMEAINEGLRCALDHTEYDLHADSHESLFHPNFTALLHHQSRVGWEYFLKGFLVKDWGYIQGGYYTQMKLNARKFNISRWVVNVLMLLNNFRSSMWALRNAAIHGGPTLLTGSALRKRLIRDIKELYSRDRSLLSLADKELFMLPLRFRLKQGNHHLLLWTKRAFLTFDAYTEIPIDKHEQKRITDWLQIWDDDIVHTKPEYMTTNDIDTCDSTDREIHHAQMSITDWLHSWGDINAAGTLDGATASSTVATSE